MWLLEDVRSLRESWCDKNRELTCIKMSLPARLYLNQWRSGSALTNPLATAIGLGMEIKEAGKRKKEGRERENEMYRVICLCKLRAENDPARSHVILSKVPWLLISSQLWNNGFCSSLAGMWFELVAYGQWCSSDTPGLSIEGRPGTNRLPSLSSPRQSLDTNWTDFLIYQQVV